MLADLYAKFLLESELLERRCCRKSRAINFYVALHWTWAQVRKQLGLKKAAVGGCHSWAVLRIAGYFTHLLRHRRHLARAPRARPLQSFAAGLALPHQAACIAAVAMILRRRLVEAAVAAHLYIADKQKS